jgi:hypothetical protein
MACFCRFRFIEWGFFLRKIREATGVLEKYSCPGPWKKGRTGYFSRINAVGEKSLGQ